MAIGNNIISRTLSPLRYPGGKSVISGFISRFIDENKISNVIYIEPYAGGAGAALNLLFNKKVSSIVINDANIAIYSFWDSLINHSDDFLTLFDNITPNLTTWTKQRKIFQQHKNDLVPSLELGFATFFLNRVNRSGVLGGGPIGGKTKIQQEKSKYKIDARYNKVELRKRFSKIIDLKENIKVSKEDALTLLKTISSQPAHDLQKTLVYLDPPYYIHGKKLYMDFYKPEDHINLSNFLNSASKFKWILSYDNTPEIKKLYKNFEQYIFPLRYSVNIPREGSELLLHSKNSNLTNKVIFETSSGKKVFLKKVSKN